jgi:hypothetical protein
MSAKNAQITDLAHESQLFRSPRCPKILGINKFGFFLPQLTRLCIFIDKIELGYHALKEELTNPGIPFSPPLLHRIFARAPENSRLYTELRKVYTVP